MHRTSISRLRLSYPYRTEYLLGPAVVIMCLTSLAGCGSSVALQSQWRQADVVIDGANSEWNDNSVYLEDPGAVVGIYNDEDFVYLSLVTSDQKIQRQILMSGFTVWFDPKNGKRKDFGVRFPLGMEPAEIFTRDARPSRDEKTEDFNPQKMLEKMVESQHEFDIIGPSGMGVRRVQTDDGQGIEVKLGFLRGALVYELKVPLARGRDRFYAVGAAPGQIIGVGFESPEIDRGDTMGRMGGGPPGGMSGRPGGFSGGPAGMGSPRGGGFERPEPFEVWSKVTLAADA